MKVSICITTLNEEKSIATLLESLLNQTKKPDKIVIVDGGSTDKTIEIIRHYQKKNGRVKLFVQKCSRAEGRNLAIEIAKGDIIAMTDAGCKADRQWLQKITDPLINKEVDMVAGFYKMTSYSSYQKAESIFLGTTSNKFDINFLPSTRSISFKKKLWEDVGGFPEKMLGAAEDSVFVHNVVEYGARIARVKSAIVEWGMPETIKTYWNKISSYAEGDVKSKIWWNSIKGISSHNIKVLFVFLRYLVGIAFLIFSFHNPRLMFVLALVVVSYILFAFCKVYLIFGNIKTGLWGMVLQFCSDFAVMFGFLKGLFLS